jgi:protein-arginine kinase activator protein McsA
MVTFDKRELENFSLEELKKMINIQIKSEKFEGASLIRDIIEERKKEFGIGNGSDDNAELL